MFRIFLPRSLGKRDRANSLDVAAKALPGGIDGFQLARQARDEHSGLKDNILNKPYNKRELAEKVRRTLDENG